MSTEITIINSELGHIEPTPIGRQPIVSNYTVIHLYSSWAKDKIEPRVFGPCVYCGTTNYGLSCGGVHCCAACDCGRPREACSDMLRAAKILHGRENDPAAWEEVYPIHQRVQGLRHLSQRPPPPKHQRYSGGMI